MHKIAGGAAAPGGEPGDGGAGHGMDLHNCDEDDVDQGSRINYQVGGGRVRLHGGGGGIVNFFDSTSVLLGATTMLN